MRFLVWSSNSTLIDHLKWQLGLGLFWDIAWFFQCCTTTRKVGSDDACFGQVALQCNKDKDRCVCVFMCVHFYMFEVIMIHSTYLSLRMCSSNEAVHIYCSKAQWSSGLLHWPAVCLGSKMKRLKLKACYIFQTMQMQPTHTGLNCWEGQSWSIIDKHFHHWMCLLCCCRDQVGGAQRRENPRHKISQHDLINCKLAV